MSHIKLLEHVMELLASEQNARADQLLHQIIVEKGRHVYEALVNDEEHEDHEDEEDGEYGSETDEFIDDVTDDKDNIETDELADGEADEFNFDGEEDEELSIDDRLESLEDQLAALTAEFDARMDGEDGDIGDEFQDGQDEFQDGQEEFQDGQEEFQHDQEEFEDDLHEATEFYKAVPDVGASREGKFVGTGAKSKSVAVDTKSLFTKEVPKRLPPQKVVDFAKGTRNDRTVTSTKDTIADNLNTPTKKVSQDQKGDGKLVGTGKNTPKSTINTKSPLTKAPK